MDSEVSSVDSRVAGYREDIKQLVQSHLTSLDLSREVEQLVDAGSSEEELGDDVIFQRLTERGLIGPVFESVDRLVREREADRQPPAGPSPETGGPPEGGRALELRLLRARAFLEHLPSDEQLPGAAGPTFSIHACFQGQRQASAELPCLCELELQLRLRFSLSAPAPRDLLAVSEPVSLVLVRSETDGHRSLIGTAQLDWRRGLAGRGLGAEGSLEVRGVGSEAAVPAGALEYSLRLELSPGETAFLRDNPITRKLYEAQLSMEQDRRSEQQRLFLIYSKQWSLEFYQLRPSHRTRPLPLYPPSEVGNPRLACSYVTPLRTHRLIESPRAALRFCSLIPRRPDPAHGPPASAELWLSRLSVLASRGAGPADRAVLLCSLLLGFGLSAFVCAGTDRTGGCYWVATVDASGPTLFWDPSSGQRHAHRRQTVSDALEGRLHPREYPYLTLGSLFNHKHFYANLQETDSVPLCSFQLLSSLLWKSLDPEAIRAVSLPAWPPAAVPLLPPALPGPEAAERLERELRQQLARFRLERGLGTRWDEQLGYLLAPALVSYEAERELGCAPAGEEFQQAVRGHVRPGHTFKGYPVQFNSCEAGRLFRHSLKSELCQEIVCCRGDSLLFAVRARVSCYPDSVCAVWVMWACHYACAV